MLQDLIATLASGAQMYWASSGVWMRVVLTVSAIWIFWRIWRFTILPLFRPNEPVELPYWIPCKAPYAKMVEELSLTSSRLW